MRLLVVGGTLFLGRHVVDAALAAGHDVTLFNRGKTNPGLYPRLEHLVGDRDGDLSALGGKSFDAVVDTCGYVPRIVRRTAEALAGRVGHYTFVSSMSVYAGTDPRGDEASTPIEPLEDPASEDVQKHYGALKARCETALEEVFPGCLLQARAGMLIGPHDKVRRFPYWIERLAEGGEVLAPGSPDAPLQVLDARDLAAWMVRAAEGGVVGAFNLTGPERPLRMADFLATVGTALGGKSTFTWADDEFLVRHGLEPVDSVVYWLPRADHDFFRRDIKKALAAGLTFRPLADTARDTWATLQTHPFDPEKFGVRLKSGVSRERESELLAAWRAESAARG